MTRTGWTSEVGYEIYLTDSSKGTEVYEAIMEAGAAVRRQADRPVATSGGSRARIFNWGADMTYENNAFEMGLDRLVDFGPPRRGVDLDRGAAARSGRGRRRGGSTASSSTATRSRRSTT